MPAATITIRLLPSLQATRDPLYQERRNRASTPHYNVGGTGASFTNFAAPGIQQSFGSNQTVGGQTVVGALDIYRILGTAAGNVVGSNTLGAGQYTSTLTLDASGNVGAVPEPSTYALFGLAAVGLIAFRHRFQKA